MEIDVSGYEFKELLNSRVIDLHMSNDFTMKNNLGVINVLVSLYSCVDDEKEDIYVVDLEEVGEISNHRLGLEKVLDQLYYNATYETGEIENIKAFTTENAAMEYAQKKYPEINFVKKVNDIFNEKDWNK